MGRDICIVAQRRGPDGWETVSGDFAAGSAPFDFRNFLMHQFLMHWGDNPASPSDVEPRGFPEDFTPDIDDDYGEPRYMGDHSYSWLSVSELLNVDYDQMLPDPYSGGGELRKLRDMLGEEFMSDLAKLKDSGAERIVFGFDC